MVSAKRWWVALLVAALLLTGSAAAWVYYLRPSPKPPARARQVMATEINDGAVRQPLAGTENIKA